MGVVVNLDSEYGKELMKWEQFPRHTASGEVVPAGNPYVFRPYPKMLYKAQQGRDGKVRVFADVVSPYGWTDPVLYQQAQLEAEAFTKSCQRTVGSEHEQQQAEKDGWCDSPAKALAFHEGLQQDIARAAAEAAHRVQGMTEKARTEFEQAADSTIQHVTDVKGTKKGPKAVTVEG